MTAWRYWRLYVTADNGGGGQDISDITMDIATVDQTDPTVAITAATAESSFDATTLPQYAFDASLTTRWASDFTGYPTWISYDFGAGTPVALDQMTVRIFSAANRGPRDFLIQCSHDNVNWVTAYTGTGVTWSSSTERKTFTFTAPTETAPNPRTSQMSTQVLAEEDAEVRLSQVATLVLWGVDSTAQVSQVNTQILGRAPVRRTIGITF